MTTDIIMPQLGESIHEGTIGQWLKKPGDKIERFEPLVEVLTDKVNSEIPAPIDGTLTEILIAEGETVEVGTVIARMSEVGATTKPAPIAVQSAVSPKIEYKPIVTAATREEAKSSGVFPSGNSGGGWFIEDEEDDWTAPAKPIAAEQKQPHRYSPAVRRLAEEHNLDLATLNLQGSGLGGRITRDDIQNYLSSQWSVVSGQNKLDVAVSNQQPELAVSNPQPVVTSPINSVIANPTPNTRPLTPATQLPPSVLSSSSSDFVPLTPMRKAIAEHMSRSKQTIPHAWTIVEVDMTALVKYRAKIKEEFKQREGLDLTYLPFVIQAVIEGLKQFPHMNAAWASEGNGFTVKRDLNIGVAIDVPDGLVVPVIAHADEKNLLGLTRSLSDLVNRARTKKLTLTDLQGGTFTVNNPGAFGSVLSYPIINQGQTGIITMEAIVKRPVVIDDAIAIRSIMNMCLSFDHRVVDGAYAGRFLQAVKTHLQGLGARG